MSSWDEDEDRWRSQNDPTYPGYERPPVDPLREALLAALPEADTSSVDGGTFAWGSRAGWNSAREAVIAVLDRAASPAVPPTLLAALGRAIHAAAFYGSHGLSDCACIELARHVLEDGDVLAAIAAPAVPPEGLDVGAAGGVLPRDTTGRTVRPPRRRDDPRVRRVRRRVPAPLRYRGHPMKRFFRWLNKRLNIIETDPEKNRYYDLVDQALDAIEAQKRRNR